MTFLLTTMANDLPRIDHIIIACKDVHLAADDIYKRFGLASYEGGKHQGTASNILETPECRHDCQRLSPMQVGVPKITSPLWVLATSSWLQVRAALSCSAMHANSTSSSWHVADTAL